MKNIVFIIFILAHFHSFSQPGEFSRKEFEKITVEIKSIEDLRVVQEYSMIINNEEAYRNAVFVDYEDQFRKLSSFKMEVFDPGGKRVKSLGQGKLSHYSISQSFETTDANYVVMDPQYQNYPFKVRVKAVFDHKGFLNLPTWIAQDGFNMGVDTSILQVIFPETYELRYLEDNMPSNPVKSKSDENRNSITWSVGNLKPKEKEIDYRRFIEDQPKVYLAPSEFNLDGYIGDMTKWENFAIWFADLNNGRNELLPATKEMLDKLAEKDVRSIVEAAYSYMQNQTRYVSIQLGIGGFQSLPSDFVDEYGYGECKALTNYMKAMLDYKGIESNYILVKAGADVDDIIYDFPSNQFNHVFLGVPNGSDTIFLECTSQTIPPNYIGSFTDDRHALWIGVHTGEIIKTPSYSAKENRIIKDAEFDLNSDGNAEGVIATKYSGVFFDNSQIYQTYSEDQLRRYNLTLFDYKDYSINSFTSTINKEHAEFNTEFNLSVRNLARKSEDRLIINANLLQSFDHYLQIDRVSKIVEIKRGFTIDETVNLILPKDCWIERLPKDHRLETEFGRYNISFVSNSSKEIVLKRTLVLSKGTYDEMDYDRFLDFINAIRKADRNKIVLHSGT